MIEIKEVFVEKSDESARLKDISFTAEKNEIFVIVGEHGCGKTTLLNLITRKIRPFSGQVLINGNDIYDFKKKDYRKRISLISENLVLFSHMTVAQNIGLPLCIENIEKDNREDIVKEVLDFVGLDYEDYSDKFPNELSNKEKQKITFARAIANDPGIILMDEPLSILDNEAKQSSLSELLIFKEIIDKAIIFTTEDIDEALKIGDKIAIMKDGCLIQQGRPQEILKHPKNEYVEYFVGKNRLVKSPDMFLAKDIMDKSVATISEESSPIQASLIMRRKDSNVLVVVESKDEKKPFSLFPVGIVGPSQIKKAFMYDSNIGDIMRRDIKTVKEDMPLNDVLELRDKYHQYNLPVLDEDKSLKGIITERTLLNVLSLEKPEIEEVR